MVQVIVSILDVWGLTLMLFWHLDKAIAWYYDVPELCEKA